MLIPSQCKKNLMHLCILVYTIHKQNKQITEATKQQQPQNKHHPKNSKKKTLNLHIHEHTDMRTQTCAHTHAHTHMRTHTCAHTHTNMHAHTQFKPGYQSLSNANFKLKLTNNCALLFEWCVHRLNKKPVAGLIPRKGFFNVIIRKPYCLILTLM